MGSPLTITRPLDAADAESFRALRLMAIATSPTSIWPTHQEESARTLEEIEARIRPTATQIVFGLFVGSELIGIAGLRREALQQIGHKGWVWGVFVKPSHRGRGYARTLFEALMAHARTGWGLSQLLLSVNADNVAAQGLYESLGFATFGVEPRAMRVGDRYFDERHMILPLLPWAE
ncbi:MAG TPA: GNAT family N-acetyltransferase [Holophagaceae bacterium]|nr:GNAT family N-acetyltransferase [Holophagaceae bacterium]